MHFRRISKTDEFNLLPYTLPNIYYFAYPKRLTYLKILIIFYLYFMQLFLSLVINLVI